MNKYYISREKFNSLNDGINKNLSLEASFLDSDTIKDEVEIKVVPLLRSLDNKVLVKTDMELIFNDLDIDICKGEKDLMLNMIYTLKNNMISEFKDMKIDFRETSLCVIGVIKHETYVSILVNIVFKDESRLSDVSKNPYKIIDMDCKDIPESTKIVIGTSPMISGEVHS